MSSPVAEKIKPQTPPARRRISFVELRARFPLVLRFAAIGALILTIVFVAVGFWRSRNNGNFVLPPGTPQLSTEVIAVVNGYERRVTEGDKLKMLIRADRDTTFADGHHELDNIFLEVYPDNSEKPDRVTAAKAVYIPGAENPENFLISFAGNVNFETRDNLKAQTEQITYDKDKEIAQTASQISFSRENISGSAAGAVINVKEKLLELQNQVEINVAPGGNLAKNSLTDFGTSAVKINSAKASFDQDLARLELTGGVSILVTPQNGESLPTTIRAEKAVYEKDSQRMELHNGVEIVTASDNVMAAGGGNLEKNGHPGRAIPVVIRAENSVYEQKEGKVNLNGNASVEQGGELLKGDNIKAFLNDQKKLQKVFTRGAAFLRTSSGERATEVNSAEMFAQFNQTQQLNLATATGEVRVRSLNSENIIDLSGANSLQLNFAASRERSLLEKMRTEGNTNVVLNAPASPDYSQIQMSAPNWTEVLFSAEGENSVLRQMQTGGRTEVKMLPPQASSQNPRATNKRLISDSIKLFWNNAGKDLNRAEALGNAELNIIPLGQAADLDRQNLFAHRFDCEFFEAGNLAKNFTATGAAKAVLEPTAPSGERGVKIINADKISGNFARVTQAVERVDAAGNAKFNEQDRNGTASSFSYTAADETVRLRGGEPTVWDSRARLKAAEIDWNTRTEISHLRGKVATTYYSQEQTRGAAPFSKVNSPVFLTSNQAEFNHAAGIAVYLGNARAWQDNNFVRAEKLILRRDNGSMFGEGRVQSALYNARRSENGASRTVPVFASSDRISYSDGAKLLRYESNVDIRQGTERITGGVAEVYLNAKNEVEKTLAERSVVVTQPGRKATGDWAQYTAADEVVVMRGNPVYIEDAVQGNSTGRQVTVYLRENRFEGQGGATRNAPGRVRSTHNVKQQ